VAAGLYTAVGTWAYFAWYYGVPPLPRFKVGGDGYFGLETYAGGSDKLGHLWANLLGTRLGFQILRAGGWGDKPAAAISAGLATVFFTAVEIKDGYYYQLSPGDVLANSLGAALGVAMDFYPRFDELFDLRVEYWPSDEYRAIVGGEAEAEINTVNVAEDYSGQIYLAALHLGAIGSLGERRWSPLRWVDAVIGYHADNYKPDPLPDMEVERTQRLFLGVSLNMQGVVDDLLAGDGWRSPVRKAGHAFFEIGNLPFTSAPLLETSRSSSL
jgi:hypothetical protein